MKLASILFLIATIGCISAAACTDSGEGGFSSSESDGDSDGDNDGDGDSDRTEVDTSIFPDAPDNDEVIMGNCATGPCVVNVSDCRALGGVADDRYRCVSGICCNTEGLEVDTDRGSVDTDIFPDIPTDNFNNGTCASGPCVVNRADCTALGGVVDARYTCVSGICCNTSDVPTTDTGADTETSPPPADTETDTGEGTCQHKCTSGPIECSITLEGTIVPGVCPDNGTCCDLGGGDTDSPDAGDGGLVDTK